MISDTKELFRKYADPEEFDLIKETDTVVEMWERCLSLYSGRTAVSDNGTEYTYERLGDDAAGFRTLLAPLRKGARVAILSANSYDFVKAFIAVTTAGDTAVALPAHLDGNAVLGCSMMLGVSCIVYQPELEDRLSAVAEKRPDILLIRADSLCDK